jgi:hypothetical protein
MRSTHLSQSPSSERKASARANFVLLPNFLRVHCEKNCYCTSVFVCSPRAVEVHLAIDHVRHVAAPAQELHYFLASTCQLCPF